MAAMRALLVSTDLDVPARPPPCDRDHPPRSRAASVRVAVFDRGDGRIAVPLSIDQDRLAATAGLRRRYSMHSRLPELVRVYQHPLSGIDSFFNRYLYDAHLCVATAIGIKRHRRRGIRRCSERGVPATLRYSKPRG